MGIWLPIATILMPIGCHAYAGPRLLFNKYGLADVFGVRVLAPELRMEVTEGTTNIMMRDRIGARLGAHGGIVGLWLSRQSQDIFVMNSRAATRPEGRKRERPMASR